MTAGACGGDDDDSGSSEQQRLSEDSSEEEASASFQLQNPLKRKMMIIPMMMDMIIPMMKIIPMTSHQLEQLTTQPWVMVLNFGINR